jgi:hypothetical protein
MVHELELCERHRKPVTDLFKHARQSPIGIPDRNPYERVTWDRLQQEAQSAE